MPEPRPLLHLSRRVRLAAARRGESATSLLARHGLTHRECRWPSARDVLLDGQPIGRLRAHEAMVLGGALGAGVPLPMALRLAGASS